MSCGSFPTPRAAYGWSAPSRSRCTRTGCKHIATSTWTICASTRRRPCAWRRDAHTLALWTTLRVAHKGPRPPRPWSDLQRILTQLVAACPDRACGQAGGEDPRMPGGQAKEIRAPGAAGGIHRPRDGPRNRHMRLCRPAHVGQRIGAVGPRHVVAASGRQTPGFAGGQIGTGAGASRTSDLDPAGTPAAHAEQAGDDPPRMRGARRRSRSAGRPNGCAGRATARQGNRRMRLSRPAPDAMLHRAWPHHASVVA